MHKIKTFLLLSLLITIFNTSCKKDDLKDRSRIDVTLTGKWLLVAYHNDDGDRSWWSKPNTKDKSPIPTLEFLTDGTHIDSQHPWLKSYKLIAPGNFVTISESNVEVKYRFFETERGELIIHPEVCIDGYGCLKKYKRL